MRTGRNLVIGVFEQKIELLAALETLRGQGFRNEDVSALVTGENAAAPGFQGTPLGWLNEAGELGRFGEITAAGPLLRALRSDGGHDDISAALTSFGIPGFDAEFYAICGKAGKQLLAVHTEGEECLSKARATLASAGALSISNTRNAEGDEAPDERPLFAEDLREVV